MNRLLFLLIISSSLFLSACKKKQTTTTTERTVAISKESFVVLQPGALESGPAISGTLTPKKEATIRAQIGGSVLQTFAEQGQFVKAGEVLATLDDRSLTDAVQSAQSAVTTARSNLTLSKREEDRLEALVKAGAVAQRDVEAARRNTVTAQGQLSQAEAQLAAAQKQLSYTRITAPMSGKVSEKTISTGDVIQPGTALYTVVDPSSLQLEAFVPADQLSEVRIGVPVQFRVTGYQDQTFTGTVTRINPSVDPTTRQVRIYVEIPNTSGTLLGDLYAEGRVASKLKTALVLPEAAIDRHMVSPSVLRLNQGKVERVIVTLGAVDEQNNRVQILTGVNSGDTILLGAAQSITPGTSVTVTTQSTQTGGQQTQPPGSVDSARTNSINRSRAATSTR